MKSLVVYYSMSGNVKQTAELISEVSGADLLALHPVKEYPSKGAKKFIWGGKSALMGDKPKLQPYIFEADKYDMIIFGSPVWASSFTPPIRTFIEENREALSGKRIAAFYCFLGGGDKKAFKKLAKFLGIEDFAAELVLIEPVSKPKEESRAQVERFCEELKTDD
ncbi:MAG: flavodoxin [Ruminococcus sp.]|nr:flavodoxin [Ruminococcus sp.]